MDRERELDDAKNGVIPNKTFGELLDRYAENVSSKKRGARWETLRIGLVKRSKIAAVSLRVLNSAHVSEWRDERLKSVSSASVRREWNLLCHACEIGRKDWKWLKHNPFREATRPKPHENRQRLFTNDDLNNLESLANTEIKQQVMRLVHFCIETGMRASEACGLKEIRGNVAYLGMTKNGTSREVPLSQRAVELFKQGWSLTPAQLDANFRKMRDEAGLKDLHFHDTRRTAITRLAKKLDVLQLAKMVGHKDLKQLMVYFNESAEDIARKL